MLPLSMTKIKITQTDLNAEQITSDLYDWIEDNGFVRIQASPMSEHLDLWECVGGHVWTFEQIENAFDDYRNEQAQEAMADCGPA